MFRYTFRTVFKQFSIFRRLVCPQRLVVALRQDGALTEAESDGLRARFLARACSHRRKLFRWFCAILCAEGL